MWIVKSAANTQTGSILPRQGVTIRATGGGPQATVAPLHKGNERQRPGIGGDAGAPRKVAVCRWPAHKNLFRHRSGTIGNGVWCQVLDIMVGVAGFEPATPSSRTRLPPHFIGTEAGLHG